MNVKKIKQNKTEALILHFAKEVPLHLGAKKLAKLMYFADFTAYELFDSALSKTVYKKFKYGPIPVGFYATLRQMQEKSLINYEEQKVPFETARIDPNVEPNYALFSEDEMGVIKLTTEKYRTATAGELEKKAQGEPPYIMVEFDEEIPYHLAYYRNTFNEMDVGSPTDSA